MTTITALFAATLLFLAIREHRAWQRRTERNVRRMRQYNDWLIDMLDDKEE